MGKLSWKNKRKLKKLALMHLIHQEAERENANRKKKYKKRKWWVRPHLAERKEHGHFHKLLPTLRNKDRESFFR